MELFKHIFIAILLAQMLWLPSLAADTSSKEKYIVYVSKARPGQDREPYYIKTLASVLGSEAAAKEALVFSYKNSVSGFSALLTPTQVSQLKKQTGVLRIIPDKTVHGGDGNIVLDG